jgi:hypothetical protein
MTKNPHIFALACSVAIALFGANAAAQDRPPPTFASGDSLVIVGCDRNFDAVTSQAEMSDCVTQMFAAADKDRSGSVGTFEFEDWRKLYVGNDDHSPYRLEIDRNMDSRITSEELTFFWNLRFSTLDSDKDGSLTRRELYRDLPRPNFAKMLPGGPGGMPPGRRPGGGARPSGGGGRPF